MIELFGGFFKTLVLDWNVWGFFKTCCFGLKCLEDFLKFVLLDRNVWAFFKTCCFGLKCLEDFLKLFWLFIEIWFHLCFCCVFNNKLRYWVWVQKSRFIYWISFSANKYIYKLKIKLNLKKIYCWMNQRQDKVNQNNYKYWFGNAAYQRQSIPVKMSHSWFHAWLTSNTAVT